MFRLIRVSGDSMSPALEDGDITITIKARSLRPGFIYVINHSDLGRIIKRLGSEVDGRFPLSGDNPKSTPPAILGTVEPARISRRVIAAYGRLGLRRV